MNLEHVAGVMYSIYCQEVGGKAFNGDPLPSWEDFRADPAKLKQSNAWIAVAGVVQAGKRESRISRISVGRVYNLGNYEHVRYELTVDVPASESAASAIIAIERIIAGLKPDRISKSAPELERERSRIDELRAMPLAEFERRVGMVAGGPMAYIMRCEESLAEDIAKAEAARLKAKTARELFDNLGGAAQWKDAKMSWDDDIGGGE